MTDNVAVTAGSGTTIAADDVGGVLHQRVKVTWGPDGTANDTDVASGKPIPAQLRVSDGTAWTYGSGAIAGGTPRVTLATDSPGVTTLGRAAAASSLPTTMYEMAGEYETVAASQTNQAIGATGAAGDYLSHVVVSPATSGCGVVTILDNATTIVAFPGGGTTALADLKPFTIYVGMYSTSGAWKITTGANVSCTACGNFT